uniref:Glycolipid transfer protein domain containing 2b n=1 Tax=Astyanax mexicanus TaxID=7994 RepID=A0A3B1JC37_ASTMX
MGVKGRAAFAIIFIIVFLCTMWLFYFVLHIFLLGFDFNSRSASHPQSLTFYKPISSEDNDTAPLELCPGQKFQVAVLLMNLQAAPVSTNDVLLKPYLASWDELINFMETLGPMVGLISQEIEGKTSIIRELAKKEEAESKEQVQEDVEMGRAYRSVRSMIKAELDQGLVDFNKHTASGCRTLLRLHRALLWLQLFLRNLANEDLEAGRARSPAELCREAYQLTLAQHHLWWVRKAAELAFVAMPDRAFFYRLVCVETQAEATVILNRVVRAIQKVYDRTQVALEEHGMLDLP